MVARYAFPKEESQFYTVLKLSEYRRPRPGKTVNVITQAYIRLPMPEQLTDTYNMNLNSSELGFAGMANLSGLPSIKDIVTSGGRVAEALKNDFSGTIRQLKDKISQYSDSIAPGIADLYQADPAKFLALTPGVSENIFGQAAQLETGLVRNPHLTTIFDGVKLREFTFSWKLSPKSSTEAQEMATMINDIKKFMHPEIVYKGFALNYPYLAEVDFLGGSTTYNTLPKVGRSFISGMSVNNLTSGVAAFYTDGRPITVDLTLSFNEINIKTRQDFAS